MEQYGPDAAGVELLNQAIAAARDVVTVCPSNNKNFAHGQFTLAKCLLHTASFPFPFSATYLLPLLLNTLFVWFTNRSLFFTSTFIPEVPGLRRHVSCSFMNLGSKKSGTTPVIGFLPPRTYEVIGYSAIASVTIRNTRNYFNCCTHFI